MALRRLIIVRHAQSEANAVGSLHCTVPGPALTDQGLEQAEKLVATLADEDVRSVWSSTMIRARLSAHQSIDDLVPAAVARHIVVHHLYGAVGDLHGND